MNIYWQKLIKKIIFWLLAEIVLNLLGIDEIADYNEFLLSLKEVVQVSSVSTQTFIRDKAIFNN